MVLYNTLMGVCAGSGLILVAKDLKRLAKSQRILVTDSIMYLVLGIPLFILSLHMTLTWPLTVNPPINIAFAEPGLIFGSLMIFAGVLTLIFSMLERDKLLNFDHNSSAYFVVFVVGLIMLAISSAIFSYDLVGDAPPEEPITGQFTGWENIFFGVLYLIVAIGCMLAPLITWNKHVYKIIYWCFMISGITFLLFSVLNYRTHIGLLINFEHGTNHKW